MRSDPKWSLFAMNGRFKHHSVLFWLGVIGIIFYVIAPIVFPDIPNLRQPELLPVYTLMMGLGQLLKGNSDNGGDKDEHKTS